MEEMFTLTFRSEYVVNMVLNYRFITTNNCDPLERPWLQRAGAFADEAMPVDLPSNQCWTRFPSEPGRFVSTKQRDRTSPPRIR